MIIVRLNGGLGNQLFQYAFAKSLSIQKKVPFLLDDRYLIDRTPRRAFTFREYDLSIFNIQVNFFKQGKTLLPYWVYADKLIIKLMEQLSFSISSNLYVEPYFHFNPNYIHLSNDCYCIGYFQSYKYLEPIKEILKEELSFKDPISSNCINILSKIQNSNSVCVHIRKGDFINHTFHGTIKTSYYYDAVKHLSNQITSLQLFVFSDDINWCKTNLSFAQPTIYVDDIYAGLKGRNHFELMMNCRHFIISNSSFAWWAAYLAKNSNKKVVAPLAWLNNKKINTKDITPPDWVRL